MDTYPNSIFEYSLEAPSNYLDSVHKRNLLYEANVFHVLWDLYDTNKDVMKPTQDKDTISNTFKTMYKTMTSKKHPDFQSFYNTFIINTAEADRAETWKVFNSRALAFDNTPARMRVLSISTAYLRFPESPGPYTGAPYACAVLDDDVGIAAYQWVLDGKALTKVINTEQSAVPYYLLPNNLKVGDHTLELRAWDYEGNAAALKTVKTEGKKTTDTTVGRFRAKTYTSQTIKFKVDKSGIVFDGINLIGAKSLAPMAEIGQPVSFELNPDSLALQSDLERETTLSDISKHDAELVLETFDLRKNVQRETFTVDKNNTDITIYSVSEPFSVPFSPLYSLA